MKRRAFLSAGCALGMAPVVGVSGFAGTREQTTSGKEQYFEWIRYQLHVGKKQGLVAGYYRDVAIPALNKAGIGNIGVFNVKNGISEPTLHVIIPHPSLESVITANDRLLSDKDFVQAGERFLDATMSDMAFIRMEKTILKAFKNLPEIQVPTQKKTNSSRIFQIRTYESPSLVAARKKIHMFNEGNEIEIFKRTGLQPVLFGETIAGERMPSLVYILVFDNMEALNKNWGTFGADPEWRKLSADPYYADTVSCINDWIWTPAPFSQI